MFNLFYVIGSQQKVLRIHPKDNVLVAPTGLKEGAIISFADRRYELQNDIAA